MGIIRWIKTYNMMKSILFAALVAAVYADAEPKADADAYYYGGYYGLGAYGYHAIGKRSADAEPTADADAYYYGGYYGLGAYGYRSYGASPYYRSYGYHAIGKRSADAEPT